MTETIHIRPANEADLLAITTILRAVVQNPYGSGEVDEDEVIEELARISSAFKEPVLGRTLMAEDQATNPLGFTFFGPVTPKLLEFTKSDPTKTLELKLLYPDPTQRSRGVGSTMLRAVEQHAEENRLTRVELTSGPRYFLIGSGIFYQKMGYRDLGTIRKYFNDTYPAKVFQKDLI